MQRTIIVVDDEPIIRLDLCQMLESLDFHVVALHNIDNAFFALQF